MWRTVEVVSAGVDTTASRWVTRESASAVSRSASSTSLRARSSVIEGAGDGAAVAVLAHERVHVVTVAGVGRHPAGRRVRVRQHAELLELGEVVADRRRGGAEREALGEMPRADRRRAGDVLLDDEAQDLFLTWFERHVEPFVNVLAR